MTAPAAAAWAAALGWTDVGAPPLAFIGALAGATLGASAGSLVAGLIAGALVIVAAA